MPHDSNSSSTTSPTTTEPFVFPETSRFDPTTRAATTRPSISTATASSTTPSTSRAGPSAGRSPVDHIDHIEMEPIVGHRRRKSSLMGPLAGQQHTAAGPGRPRDPSARTQLPQSQSSGFGEEPKIPEEDDAHDAGAGSKDERERDSFSDEDLQDDEETGLADKDRRRRQKKRGRNTLLDQRIVRQKNMSADERREADKHLGRRLLTNALLIFLWYLFSLSISLYNKWMFDEDELNFAFPLFTTSMHMVVQFILAVVVLYLFPSLRPNAEHNSDQGRSRHESEPNKGSGMSKMFYLTRIGPCGAATGLDIGLGNTSLKIISLTFYTMCKSSSLAFVLLFAFILRLETPTWRLVAIIGTMTLGVVLMVFGEVEFELGGFILVISAAFFSGARWGLTQILLLRNPSTSNPFSTIFYLTPVMFLTLFLLAIPVEGFVPLWEAFGELRKEWGALAPLFLMFPGCIAFCMTAAEFALLKRTSVVTLSIAGIFKEVVTISAASVVFKDKLTVINLVGLLTTMTAIVAYNYLKITKMRQEAQVDVHGPDADHGDSSSPSSHDGSDADDGVAEEARGLLRPSMEVRETLFTSDGDVQPVLIAPKQHSAEEHQAHLLEEEA